MLKDKIEKKTIKKRTKKRLEKTQVNLSNQQSESLD